MQNLMNSKEKKIVFFTFHNWETKRQGGFHKFAEYFTKRGFTVYFVSVPRPYYSLFKNDERLNREVFEKLNRGIEYKIHSGLIVNLTFPTLDLPGALRKFVNDRIDLWFRRASFKNLNRFLKKNFHDCSYFVFESCEAILYFDRVKSLFPQAQMIYRPSDPLIVNPSINYFIKEIEMDVLKKADYVFVVNEENMQNYETHIPGISSRNNVSIINNGVSLEEYQKEYPKPDIFKGLDNVVLYVGARDIDWDLIIHVSKKNRNVNYFIVCPESPNEEFGKEILRNDTNIHYIKGVYPKEVPSLIVNCDVFIVPNPRDRYLHKNWGLTAKYLQAMIASKPIVAYHDSNHLSKYGFPVVYEEDNFYKEVMVGLTKGKIEYEYNFEEKNWDSICSKFYHIITDEK